MYTKASEYILETTNIEKRYASKIVIGNCIDIVSTKVFASIRNTEQVRKGRKKPRNAIINNVKEFDQ